MLIRPNPSSGVPVYAQLVDQLAHAIETGAFRPGEPLPDVRPLAEALVVNPNTVARAYQTLEARGMATRRSDAGAWLASSGDGRKQCARAGLTDGRSRQEILHDLAAAHDVQQRLLPQDAPSVAGVECGGLCRPALGVGGDYFDFIRVSDVELGIAIGDVSGKGMPAALLMATLRACLRGQTMTNVADLAGMMATLNQLVYESSASNRYATLFYAEYNAARRTLRYVNAGHHPPLIVRAGGSAVRLDPSGPVIGLMTECAFVERRLVLAPGDLLFAHTDGVSEAMNAAGDEWGDERLVSAVMANASRPLRQLLARVVAAADAFAAGAPQHDDMTVAAVRIG